MERPPRGYEEVNVEALGIQLCKDRFKPSERTPSPKVSTHRNNLVSLQLEGNTHTASSTLCKAPVILILGQIQTALSQSRNLYFVAYITRIFVYEPQYPSQALGSQPALIIRPPISQSDLPCDVDHKYPHSINHLFVADLGNDEILLCACDDGDVIGYRTRNILHAIQQEPSKLEPYSWAESLKPFFHENVDRSAWGLDVHSSARMIAASCNRHIITVFAFGLVDSETQPSSRLAETRIDIASCYSRPDARQYHSSPTTRYRNTRLILQGHKCNIPSIAFRNASQESCQVQLVSTDIQGVVIIWDVWTRTQLRRFQIRDNNSITQGWGLACLELSSFRLTSTVLETYGCARPDRTDGTWDISASIGDVRDAEGVHPALARAMSGEVSHIPTNVFVDEDEEEDDMSESDVMDDAVAAGSSPAFLLTPEPLMMENMMFDVSPSEVTDPIHAWPGSIATGALGLTHLNFNFEVPPTIAPFLALAASHLNSAIPVIPTRPSAFLSETVSERTPVPTVHLPEFAVLHTTTRDVRLYYGQRDDPRVFCHKPLDQDLPPSLHFSLRNFQRLNMVKTIPELGVIAMACQTGRVAILTLTHLRSRKQPAFRVDAILPFSSQENQNLRPNGPLLGIAVAPIQGRELSREEDALTGNQGQWQEQKWRRFEKQRRFRLMLSYYDHTILSYEIGRS